LHFQITIRLYAQTITTDRLVKTSDPSREIAFKKTDVIPITRFGISPTGKQHSTKKALGVPTADVNILWDAETNRDDVLLLSFAPNCLKPLLKKLSIYLKSVCPDDRFQ